MELAIDPKRLADYIATDGGVTRWLLELGETVKQGAQRRVGVYRPNPGDPFAARRLQRRPAGQLRDSIVKRIIERDGIPIVQVGSDDPIAFLHHEGTDPHTIRARAAPRLVFYSGKAGRVIAAPSVSHPGTKANRYLVDALDDLRRALAA